MFSTPRSVTSICCEMNIHDDVAHRTCVMTHGVFILFQRIFSIADVPVLDPDDPLFEPISRIECYFHPVTYPTVPEKATMEYIYSIYRKPLGKITEYINLVQNISNTLRAYKQREYDITKSQIAELTLSKRVNEVRIANDLAYYETLLFRETEVLERVFSKHELYIGFLEVLDPLSGFALPGLDRDDLHQVALFSALEEVSNDTTEVERCSEGKQSSLSDRCASLTTKEILSCAK